MALYTGTTAFYRGVIRQRRSKARDREGKRTYQVQFEEDDVSDRKVSEDDVVLVSLDAVDFDILLTFGKGGLSTAVEKWSLAL